MNIILILGIFAMIVFIFLAIFLYALSVKKKFNVNFHTYDAHGIGRSEWGCRLWKQDDQTKKEYFVVGSKTIKNPFSVLIAFLLKRGKYYKKPEDEFIKPDGNYFFIPGSYIDGVFTPIKIAVYEDENKKRLSLDSMKNEIGVNELESINQHTNMTPNPLLAMIIPGVLIFIMLIIIIVFTSTTLQIIDKAQLASTESQEMMRKDIEIVQQTAKDNTALVEALVERLERTQKTPQPALPIDTN